MRPPEGKLRSDWKTESWKRTFARCDDWLDRKPAVRHFDDPVLAAIVADSCYYWAGQRYDLLAYAVMPSHLHWVFRPVEPLAAVGQVANLPVHGMDSNRQVGNLPHGGKRRSVREQIMHSLKLHTAIHCNRHLGRRGRFWQEESYDHCVRDDDELERIINYVEQNPVRAGLVKRAEQWRFSSAHDRLERGILLGQPLLRTVVPCKRGAGCQPAKE
jgi:REP element-mobilizing transposase RayT